MKNNIKINNYLKKLLEKYLIIPIKVLKLSIQDLIEQDGVEHAGYLAFLNIFSLFPFLIFLILIAGSIGASEMGQSVIYSTVTYLPNELIHAILPRIEEIINGPKQSFLTIAVIAVIWTASSTVEGLRTILNRANRVHTPPPYLLRRLISIIEFIIISFVIVIVILLFVVIPKLLTLIGADSLIVNFAINNMLYIDKMLIFIFLVSAVSILYHFIPNSKQNFTKNLPGSILTVIFWYLTTKIFLIYLKEFHQFTIIYGSLTGIMVVLMFFYLINLIFIGGAQFNYHLAKAYKISSKK